MFPLLQICWLALACPDSAFFMSYMSSFCALGYGECDSWQAPLGLLKPSARIFCIKFVSMTLGRVVCSPSPPTPLSCPSVAQILGGCCAPAGMGTALGEMWGVDWGVDWGPTLGDTLCDTSVTLGTATTALGLCIPAPEEGTQPLHHFHPTVPKNPKEFPPSLVRAG